MERKVDRMFRKKNPEPMLGLFAIVVLARYIGDLSPFLWDLRITFQGG